MIEQNISKQVWERFLKEGTVDETRLRRRIVESWSFCREAGVDPYNGKGSTLLSLEELNEKKKQNHELLDMSLPFLQNLQYLFKGTRSILLLIDPEGYVLKVMGEEETLRHAMEINFVEGIRWTEEQVGTNAIGTTLRTKEPITVYGPEHFAVASQNWVCSAAPIRKDDGSLLGVLNVSSRVGTCKHEHTLGAVAASAYAIEYEWQKRQKEDELELISKALMQDDAFESYVLTCADGRVIYIHASLYDLTDYRDQTIQLDTLLAETGHTITMKIPVFSEREGRQIGHQVFLRKHVIEKFNRQIKKVRFQFPGVTGVSEVFAQVLDQAACLADADVPVHLSGETGTGKDMIARALHDNSKRAEKPFVELNCGAIPESLIASELFGYAPGAFTGARKTGYIGKFVEADQGTLFLDEVGELSPAMQVALLKVLDEQRFMPVGTNEVRSCDVRIITATNRDLVTLVREGSFREDLFYRLYAFPLHLPALRDRQEDIPAFIQWYKRRHEWHVHWPKPVMDEWMAYTWPGNIRQLILSLDRLRIYYPDSLPDPSTIRQVIGSPDHEGIRTPAPVQTNMNNPEYLINEKNDAENQLSYAEQIEKETLLHALKEAHGNRGKAMSLTGMPRSTFYRKLNKYSLI
ncbi:sigma-54-dependent Fis family transcriptional regulator [Salisediminibacterium beveridgei]|uniref:Transcriptional activator of acetoin dehydrogenase operon AcoR n=1 Tax=Salisediminibacterium beveridgei TaxID=632773 RepID=A0A1D7QYJ4_9BACI|nr:sigma-54-dependent Fis family transcriptional regulator [Salisediminibacterium beveridgei]AOM84070.1 Transcriptional activator of acetoin dehydrogenase operon AcoR [Salisediminibacterium beveridgei]